MATKSRMYPSQIESVGCSLRSGMAQACDRCRSKKIRCDRALPYCAQCAAVGFECKTSDKLSRRAFPRGYTKSLEEHVKCLAAEVKELRSLLHRKDESMASIYIPQLRAFSDTMRAESFGISSSRSFAETFKIRLVDQKQVSLAISIEELTASPPSLAHSGTHAGPQTTPRLVTDQLLTVFFQQWAPLYPVVNRLAILRIYEKYLSNPGSFRENMIELAQLYLVFSIAALPVTSRSSRDPVLFEGIWLPILQSLSGNISILTLQCYVLAQVYCMTKGDYSTLLHYRLLAVGLCHQLNLHESQKGFESNPLLAETRKKDRFCAVLTNVPVLLHEKDIRTEYPKDIDEQNVTETGFLPTLPGESTRISSALALFAASRILNCVLDDIYPFKGGYSIQLAKVCTIGESLDKWVKNLPANLCVVFSEGKPTNTTTCNWSPALSIVYYFIRSLIYRPVLCFGDLKTLYLPSISAIADSSKCIVQAIQLVDDGDLCLPVAINRRELISSSGFGLLWLDIGLRPLSNRVPVNQIQELLFMIVKLLKTESPGAAAEFNAMVTYLAPLGYQKHITTTGPCEGSPPVQKLVRSPTKESEMWEACPMRHSSLSQLHEQNVLSSCSNSIPNNYVSFTKPQARLRNWEGLPADDTERQYTADRNKQYSFMQFRRESLPTLVATSTPARESLFSAWESVISDLDQACPNIFTGICGGKEFIENYGPSAYATPEIMQKEAHIATRTTEVLQNMPCED
ncbi:hypothetical protein ASPVEDRAFT_877887 [Aspergillus versicolor CBS 583.65]|uniref:Zn(2)-C6 fungal-type domain-containing protein n=1 Tax=Aspergillus versicolor CBS 583.65 TaxID=1036611 RepID=A0A1L9Q225_ASPVE|nr:uncharacterized protein ASPVEDRAFT_877887 [Aspergillus versicolor CBS 583.65]OJJ07752.1 hypothetical protein ASPVEDRAFT_877887 [Aspergillus versicolor CBS 583.65]